MSFIIQQTETFEKWHESVKNLRDQLLSQDVLKEQSMAI
jgi:hypothetical protein